MTLETPYGETADVDDFIHVLNMKGVSLRAPLLIRVIEREAIIEIVDGEPQDLSRLRVHAPSETHTYILDPEDIEYIEGTLYLVVGEVNDEEEGEDEDPEPAGD